MILDNVVFVDLETTGGSPRLDRIIEVALVEITNGVPTGEWSTLVNPERRIPGGIQTLTGITDEMVSSAPTFAEIAPALAARLAGRTFAAHNARFDYGFLRHALARAGERLATPVLCTVRLSRRLYPRARRHNLDMLLVRHALFCLDRHRALGDARVLWELAQVWRREFGDAHVDSICEDLVRPVRVPPALPPEVLDDVPEAPGTYVFYGENGLALYAGRSANLNARISAHFAGSGGGGKDAAIAREVKRVEWKRSTGELGAALRELQLVSSLRPIYNRPRDAESGLCAWRWRTASPLDPPELIDATRVSEDMVEELYGIFRTRAAARQALRSLVPGYEPTMRHAMRLTAVLAPLRIRRWPFPGAIGVRERDAITGRSEVHVLHRWCYLGTAYTDSELAELVDAPLPPYFGLESYKLLRRFLDSPPVRCQIVHLFRPQTAAA